jgi:hypothetical protein
VPGPGYSFESAATIPEVAFKSIVVVRVGFCERRRTKTYTKAPPTIIPPMTPTAIPAIAPEDRLEVGTLVTPLEEIEETAEDIAEELAADAEDEA